MPEGASSTCGSLETSFVGSTVAARKRLFFGLRALSQEKCCEAGRAIERLAALSKISRSPDKMISRLGTMLVMKTYLRIVKKGSKISSDIGRKDPPKQYQNPGRLRRSRRSAAALEARRRGKPPRSLVQAKDKRSPPNPSKTSAWRYDFLSGIHCSHAPANPDIRRTVVIQAF